MLRCASPSPHCVVPVSGFIASALRILTSSYHPQRYIFLTFAFYRLSGYTLPYRIVHIWRPSNQTISLEVPMSLSSSAYEREEQPNASRVYDYLLGGSHNFEADRQAAEQLCALYPDAPLSARVNRYFLRRVVNYLHQQGIDQFLDGGQVYRRWGMCMRYCTAIIPTRGLSMWTAIRWRSNSAIW